MKELSRLILLTLVSTLLFTACNRKTAEDTLPQQPEGPSTEQSSQPQNERDYCLQGGDTITMQIHQEPDLTTEAKIDETGTVSFPLIGKVNVKGLSVPELEQKLEKLYRKDYIVAPKINITFKNYRSSTP